MPSSNPAPAITAVELAALLGTSRQPLLVDVRTEAEHREWSIPGSVNIPLDALHKHLDALPRDTPFVVHCASGIRSRQAVEALRGAGRPALDLAGGMKAWARVYDTAEIAAGPVTIVQVRRRGKGCLSYLVGAGGEAFAVDPSTDTARYIEIARRYGWRISRVFDTHLHADHLSGARALAIATGATLHLNPADTFDFGYTPIADGDMFPLGHHERAFGVAALSAPGHTEGSTLFLVGEDAVLSGDTLFIDGVGRPDLAERAEAFARQLHRSLHERVLTLPDHAVVLPAHYSDAVAVRPDEPVAATLGALRRTLAPLAFEEDRFIAWAATQVIPRPPNHVDIVLANMGRPRLAPHELPALEAGPNRCAVSAA